MDKRTFTHPVRPDLPLPDPITSEIPGTWAYDTMSRRVVETARRTLIENKFPPSIHERIEALADAIPQEAIRYLDQAAPDAQAWATYIRPYLGQNWLIPPWFFTETYFYRRLLEATGYYEAGPGHELDPFHYQKEQGLLTTRGTIQEIAGRLQAWIADGRHDAHLAALLAIDLWGNRADLSLWPAGDAGEQPVDVDWQAAQAHTLVDDTEAVLRHLHDRRETRIDFLVDNAGLELVADLALADFLLSTGTAGHIVLHLKMHPTFVSDATTADVRAAAAFLAASADSDTAAFGQRLAAYIARGTLTMLDSAFWVSPLAFWEMPPDLRRALAQSDLIISKGDANYRRLLGDRHWPFTTPFDAILSYTPAPLLALRGLKAELASGLTPQQIAMLDETDPQWQVNGRWGVIQFALPAQAA